MARKRLSKIGEGTTKSANPIKEVKKAKKSLQNQKVNKEAKKIVPTKGLLNKHRVANNLGYDKPKTNYQKQVQKVVTEGRLVRGLASPNTSEDIRGVHRSKAETNTTINEVKKKYQKQIRQEKAAGKLGTKLRKLISNLNRHGKRGSK